MTQVPYAAILGSIINGQRTCLTAGEANQCLAVIEHLRDVISDATTRIEALEAENARLRHRVEAYREDIKEIERDAREAIAEAVSEARYQERTGDPYGTY